MLRQSRLRKADGFCQRTDTGLPKVEELAQKHEPAFVRDRLQDGRHFGRFCLEILYLTHYAPPI
ncbi:hypothetical protein Sa4125_29220 [Aureimonas sp. SA4125]|nr:hypothetical protein Sa4125_29220 [Aureimonas sp. SA4125]